MPLPFTMKHPAPVWAVTGFLAAAACMGQATPAASQPPAPAQPGEASTPPELPVQLQLGRRMSLMRQAATTLETVVIVSDAESYRAALSAWRPDKRFPVLIDDGTPQAREDIARFVRGYRPASVVRWTKPLKEGDPKPPVGAPGFDRIDPAAFNTAVQSAWGVPTPGTDPAVLAVKWRELGHQPPGLVVASAADKCWPSALALAIAWGQPTLLVAPLPGNIDWSMTPSEADTLANSIQTACEDSGYSWKGLGDDLEAITICLNCPERVSKPGKEFLALTDRIGRHGEGLDASTRFAWAGHIFGSASRSAYSAMCSIFEQPIAAWLFDGYPDGPPWNNYDCTAAADILKETGMAVEVMDKPNGSAQAWRTRAAKPVNAGLVMVNTRGNANFFDLEPGQCKPGDVPILTVPAAVSMVHSWSLLFPGKRDTLGGRWLERGAFCYVGSVNEPYLHAFVPTPTVAGRFASGAPWGATVRTDEPKIWKIAVLGDPLYAFAPRVTRSPEALALEGATPVGANLREVLLAEKFVEGVRDLNLLGRDADIARLAEALVTGKPEKVDSALAAECILPAFRADNGPLVAKLFARMNVETQKDPILRDALWLSAYPRLDRPDDDALLNLLKSNIRDDQIERDAATLAAAWSTRFGAASLPTLFADLRNRFTEKAQRDDLEKAARGR